MWLGECIKRNKKVFLVLGILFILFLAFLIISVKYTERPEFCNSCHIMKPYYKAWQESPHKDVNCLDCHYEPNIKAHIQGKINGLVQVVQYITKRYGNRPSASISDLSCLRQGCHSKDALKHKPVSFRKGIEFDHGKHFGELKAGIELKCTSCHTQLTFEEHIRVDENTCFTCHFKNVDVAQIGEQCLNCHKQISNSSEHKEYIANNMACTQCHSEVKKGDAEVTTQACYFCHADKKQIEKIKNKELLHKVHIYDNKVDCINCHQLIKHGRGN